MTASEVIKELMQYVFSFAVTGYLLWERTKTLDALTRAINDLTAYIKGRDAE